MKINRTSPALSSAAQSQFKPLPHCHSFRDLKCENIFFNSNSGVVKIGDMGLAVARAGGGRSSVGTPGGRHRGQWAEGYAHTHTHTHTQQLLSIKHHPPMPVHGGAVFAILAGPSLPIMRYSPPPSLPPACCAPNRVHGAGSLRIDTGIQRKGGHLQVIQCEWREQTAGPREGGIHCSTDTSLLAPSGASLIFSSYPL